jgi:hypothetical protein
MNAYQEYRAAQTNNARNRWIVVTPTLCQGDVPAYWDGDDKPLTYATEREAWKEVADTQIMKLQEFIEDESRNPDEEPEFEPEDYVIECNVYSNGVITTTQGVLFDPKKLSEYGR